MRITRPLVLATLIVATSLSFGQSGIGPITTSVAQSKPPQWTSSIRHRCQLFATIPGEWPVPAGESFRHHHPIRLLERFSAADHRTYQD